MRVRLGSAEAPQDQLVVRVVLRFLERYVLEQMNVYAQDEVGPGAHLPPAQVHGPCAEIVLWEEVDAHVFQSLLHQGCCNPLVPLSDLWCGKVGVEIADHQKSGPLGPLANGCDGILYGQYVV